MNMRYTQYVSCSEISIEEFDKQIPVNPPMVNKK